MKTGIVIPCYNEAKRLQVQKFKNFAKQHADYHVCFVNDGSSDQTLEVLEDIRKSSPQNVSVVDQPRNLGKAAAVREGAHFLYKHTGVDQIGFIDADLSTDFDELKRLAGILSKDAKLSMVFGSRAKGEGKIERNPLRKLFSLIFRTVLAIVLRMPIADTQCGAKVFSREVVPVAFKEAFLSKWMFDVEIFLRLKHYYGKREVMTHIQETQLWKWVHAEGSKLNMKDMINVPWGLTEIGLHYAVKRWTVKSIPASQTQVLPKTHYALIRK